MSLSVNVSVNDLTIYDLGLYFTYKSIAKKISYSQDMQSVIILR